jgi:hypothetical protein
MSRSGRYGPYLDDPDDLADEFGFTEIVDANVNRVDLVGSPAHGHGGFLIMKGSQDTLMTPGQIRALIASNTPPTQKVNNPMSDYIPGTRILKTSVDLRKAAALRKSATLRKASKPSLVAVYDRNGVLVGTCDPAKITILASAEDPNATKAPAAPKAEPPTAPSTAPEATPAPQVQPDATDGPAAGRSAPVPAAAAEVAKSLQGAGFRDGARPFADAAGRSVDARYADLVKSVDRGTQGKLGDAVAHAAMVLQISSGVPGDEAVRLAKSVALDLASVEVRRPRPSIEAAAASVWKRPLR